MWKSQRTSQTNKHLFDKMNTGCSESNASYLFLQKLQMQKAQHHYLIKQILIYQTLFFNVVTAISYTYSSTMKKSACCISKSLHQKGDPLSSLPPRAPTHHLVSRNVQQTSMNVNGCQFFHTEEFNDTFVSYMHPRQTPFCKTAPLLPYATQ